MTKDKALKRDIRARMDKTGEAFTTARHYLLDEHLETAETVPSSEEPPSPELPPRVADPGISDESIKRATGKTWDEWLAALDAWGARNKTHTEIAKHVSAEFGIGGWWSQNVTVGYERARGMRKLNEHTDGFSVNASRTFNLSVDFVYQAFANGETRSRWLEPDVIKERTFTENKVWRCESVADRSRVEVRFTSKSPDKTSIAIEHAKLPAEEDVAVWRAFWKEHLDRLQALLTSTPA